MPGRFVEGQKGERGGTFGAVEVAKQTRRPRAAAAGTLTEQVNVPALHERASDSDELAGSPERDQVGRKVAVRAVGEVRAFVHTSVAAEAPTRAAEKDDAPAYGGRGPANGTACEGQVSLGQRCFGAGKDMTGAGSVDGDHSSDRHLASLDVALGRSALAHAPMGPGVLCLPDVGPSENDGQLRSVYPDPGWPVQDVRGAIWGRVGARQIAVVSASHSPRAVRGGGSLV
jgi:hypothetical protein